MTQAGPLAFVGGGEWRAGCCFDKSIIDAVGATEVVVLPTAAAYERPQLAVAAAETWFGELGVPVVGLDVLSRPDAENADLAEVVRGARFIYFADGSPLHLRSVIKNSLLWRALVDAWHNGAAIAGAGAGATVLGDPMVDPRGGTFTLGLGLVRNIAIVPHWERWTSYRARRMSHLTPRGAVVTEIQEQTALIRWGNGTWQVQGAGNVLLKVDNQEISTTDIESIVDTISIVA